MPRDFLKNSEIMSIATQTTILLVDDDHQFRETLMDAMSLKGARVEGIANGKDALAALEGPLPSLIILDVQLPDTHGFELCRAIRHSPRTQDIPVILLSGRYTEAADRAEGLLTGAAAYLSKPVNPETLWEEVCYLLDRRG